MTRRRVALITVLVVLLLPIVAVGALLLVAQSQWGERWLEARFSKRLGREVQLSGISFGWGWPPSVFVEQLKIGNPPWATTPALLDAQGLHARVMIPPLFARRIVIPHLGARQARSGLEMEGERATWRFGNDSTRESPLQLGMVYLDDGHIVFRDRAEKTDLNIDVKGTAGQQGELRASATGQFRGEPTTATARMPNLDPLHEAPIEVDGQASVGPSSGSAKGTFASDAKTLDLRITLAGRSMKDLHKVIGVVLPDTPPYRVAGRLRHEGNDWIFDPFAGRVGDSDIVGALTYAKGGQRPLLKGNLKSKLLDFNDLGPLIGAPPKTGPGETANAEQQADAAQRAAEQRLLPDHPFNTALWDKMDADVTFQANRVMRPKQLPLDALSTHLKLTDSVLRLEPLDFGFAEGRISANITLDGRVKPMRGEMKADVQGLQLGPLFPTVKNMREALGTLYGRAELAGRGQSVAALLGTSDGRMQLAVDGGRIKALLDALIPLQMGEVLMLLGRGGDQVQLRCAVAGIVVAGGVARPDSFLVDTENTLIKVHGSLDFRNETLDFEMDPYPKKAGILSLRTPIKVTGPLRTPKAHPKAGPIAARVAVAGALAAANPVLALLATLENGPGKDTDCGKVLAEARAKGAEKKAS
jgi:AsmA family protein